jgi:hypothetical protein
VYVPQCVLSSSAAVLLLPVLGCSSYMYLLNVTIAGIYNKGYPGTNQALKVSQVFCHTPHTYGSPASCAAPVPLPPPLLLSLRTLQLLRLLMLMIYVRVVARRSTR